MHNFGHSGRGISEEVANFIGNIVGRGDVGGKFTGTS